MYKDFSILKANPDSCKRKYNENEDSLRSKFARDRDRILFSKEFRRLEGKTQVFINGFDDHIRNRLTHTLEVAQISKTISQNFHIDSTLCEAISFGHDVGHTPFGHVGERILNHFTNNCENFKDFKITNEKQKGFKHNWQGVKVVSTLEKLATSFYGLNLTDYTIWGILHHSNLEYKDCKLGLDEKCNYMHNNKNCHVSKKKFSLEYYKKFKNQLLETSWSIEGLIVSISDEIAQRHHDIEDGLIAKIIDRKDLVDTFESLFSKYLKEEEKKKLNTINNSKNENYVLHDLSSLILKFYTINLFEYSVNTLLGLIQKYNIKNEIDFNIQKSAITKEEDIFNIINFNPIFIEKDREFQEYLSNRILNSHIAQSMDGKASFLLRNLIQAYLINPQQLPDGTINTLFESYWGKEDYNKFIKNKRESVINGLIRDELKKIHNRNDDPNFMDTLIRTIVDFIAGMTDNYAIKQYNLLCSSKYYY